MIAFYKNLVPHRNRFADECGDGGVKSLVLVGMQVVDVRSKLDIKAGAFELDLCR